MKKVQPDTPTMTMIRVAILALNIALIVLGIRHSKKNDSEDIAR